MLNDPDLRNIVDDLGDYVAFELFDNGEWRPFGVSRTALHLLGGPGTSSDLQIFERHIGRIKGIAFGVTSVGKGRVILNSDQFA